MVTRKRIAENMFESKLSSMGDGTKSAITSVASVIFSRAEMNDEKDRFIELLPQLDPIAHSDTISEDRDSSREETFLGVRSLCIHPQL